jgi:putative transposase
MSEPVYKTYKHNPPHYFESNRKYFLTAATYMKKPFLSGDETKQLLLGSLKKASDKHGWVLEDWVILDNHYHIMLNSPENASTLSNLINSVHQSVAYWLKSRQKELKENRIFYNYWDTCITYEKSYYSRISYIFMNPVKHGYTEDPADYKWSSYQERDRKSVV